MHLGILKKRSVALALCITFIVISVCSCSGTSNDVENGPDKASTGVGSPETDNNASVKSDVPESVAQEKNDIVAKQDESESDNAAAEQNETESNNDAEKPDEPEENEVKDIVHIDDDTTGLEGAPAFVRKLRLGWNLGNTMDATNGATSGANLNLEMSWSGAKTTPEMIKTIKDAGFKSVRIPVSWHNHVDRDLNIEVPWMARVKTIVDYVIENDMYCIINIHHDNMIGYYYPSSEYLEDSKNYVRRIWEQVGEEFKDYDDHLIFESLNEPRLVGTANEWNLGNNDACKDAVACINELNQVFVDTIRAQGGNNADRYLLVPGYAAQWNAAVRDDFVIPNDAADKKIMIEVHAYSPYNFALKSPDESGSTPYFSTVDNGSTSDINTMMLKLKLKFIDKGIGVVVDEFGSRDKGGNTEARAEHAGYYVKKAREFGITCFWWDNNCFEGEGERFGLLDRKNNAIRYPEIAQALVDNCR